MIQHNSAGDKKLAARTPLSRERILNAAVAIADERGVAAVTMREVASALSVEAMSLYNHVSNKESLLDGMVDLVIEEIDLPQGLTAWREAMRRRAVSAREVFDRHPWLPLLLDSRQSSGPARLHYYDWVLGILIEAGFSLDGAAGAFSLLDSYIYGFGIQASNLSGADDMTPEERTEAFRAAIPAEQYPYLNQMTMHAMETGYDPEADFNFGLALVLDGLERARVAQ